MTHTFKSEKALFLAVFAVFTFSFTPNLVRAQVVDTPATTAQVDTLQQTLITLLTQLIAQLQEQINTILAQQNAQSVQLGAVQEQVSNVVQNTAPVVSGANDAPLPSLTFKAKINSHPGYWRYYNNTENQPIAQSDNYSTISITSNKQVDYSKTEVYVDGVFQVASFSNYRNINSEQRFDVSPMLESFMKLSNTQNATRTGTYTLKFYFTDGTSVTTNPSTVYEYLNSNGSGGEGQIVLDIS